MRGAVRKYVERCWQQDGHEHCRRDKKADPRNGERVGEWPQQRNLEKPVRGERRKTDRYRVLHARAGCDCAADAPDRAFEPREQTNADSPDHIAKAVANLAAWPNFSFAAGFVRGWILVRLRCRERLRESDRCPASPRCKSRTGLPPRRRTTTRIPQQSPPMDRRAAPAPAPTRAPAKTQAAGRSTPRARRNTASTSTVARGR